MSDQRPKMIAPALIGGLVAGVLSGIPLIGCLCCLWIIGGAMLAAHLLARESPLSLTAGDGAVVGVLTGIFASVAKTLLDIPMQAINLGLGRRMLEWLSEQFGEAMPSGWESRLEQDLPGPGLAWFFLGLLFTAVVFAALGALGGVLGVSLFGKKAAAPPAPPAPPPPPAAPQA
jgi:hypothetical protein